MTIVLIILLQLLSVVAGITTVIWVINRGLKIAGSFLAAWLLVLLPLLAFQQTQVYVEDFVSTYSQWGVTDIPLFSAVTWGNGGRFLCGQCFFRTGPLDRKIQRRQEHHCILYVARLWLILHRLHLGAVNLFRSIWEAIGFR